MFMPFLNTPTLDKAPIGEINVMGTNSTRPLTNTQGKSAFWDCLIVNDVHARDTAETVRTEEHTSELQSLMRISYAVFCLNNKNNTTTTRQKQQTKTLLIRT